MEEKIFLAIKEQYIYFTNVDSKILEVEVFLDYQQNKFCKLQFTPLNRAVVMDIGVILQAYFTGVADWEAVAVPKIWLRINGKGELLKIGCGVWAKEKITTYKKGVRMAPSNGLVWFEGYPQGVSYWYNDGVVTTNQIMHEAYIKRKVCNMQGFWVKWFNKWGGWSFWLFSKNGQEKIEVKSNGVAPTMEELWNGGVLHLGKETSNEMELYSAIPIMQDEWEEVASVLESEFVYLWKGKKRNNENEEFDQWQRVEVKGTSITTKVKNELRNLKITMEMKGELPLLHIDEKKYYIKL